MPVARRLAPAKPQATGRSLLPQVGRRRATSFRMSFHVSGKGAGRAECLIFPWCEVPLFDAAARGGTVCMCRAGQRYTSSYDQTAENRASGCSLGVLDYFGVHLRALSIAETHRNEPARPCRWLSQYFAADCATCDGGHRIPLYKARLESS